VIQEEELSREQMIQRGYVVPWEDFFGMFDTNRNGQLTPEEMRSGAERVNRMLELKPHEVQSHLEHMLGIKSFGGAQGYNFQGEFGKYMAPGSQGGHGLGYHQNWNHV